MKLGDQPKCWPTPFHTADIPYEMCSAVVRGHLGEAQRPFHTTEFGCVFHMTLFHIRNSTVPRYRLETPLQKLGDLQVTQFGGGKDLEAGRSPSGKYLCNKIHSGEDPGSMWSWSEGQRFFLFLLRTLEKKEI
jgi:hypothetical protein